MKILLLALSLSSSVWAQTQAYYRHHQRTTTTALETDLVNREIGIDASNRNCFVGKTAAGTAIHALCKESDTASLSGVLNVTGQANFSAAIKASNYNANSIPFFGTGGLVSEDATNFTFNNTTDRLAVKKITAADSVVLTAGTATTPLYLNAGKVVTSGAFTGTGTTFALSASPTFTGTAGFASTTNSGTLAVTGNTGLGGAAGAERLRVVTSTSDDGLLLSDGTNSLGQLIKNGSAASGRLILRNSGTAFVNLETGASQITSASIGLNGPVTASSTLSVSGVQSNSEAIALTANGTSGDGRVWKSAGAGMALRGIAGSSYDLSLFSAGTANYLLRNPTGTSNLEFPSGTTSFAGAATFSTAPVFSSLSSGRVPYLSTGGLVAQDNLYWDATNDRLGVGSGSSSPNYDMQISKSAADVNFAIVNTRNTSGDRALLQVETGGTSAGDAQIRLSNLSTSWSHGIDNSDGAAWVLSESAALGTSNRIKVATGGAVSIPGTLDLGGNEAFTYDEGTFTATSSGITGSPSGTASYVRMGKTVTLVLPSVAGTSDATTFSFSGLPAGLAPVTNQSAALPAFTAFDNSVAINSARVYIDKTGPTIRIQNNDASSGWTAGGTKGISGGTSANVVITYTLY